jgi:hypothetical protein
MHPFPLYDDDRERPRYRPLSVYLVGLVLGNGTRHKYLAAAHNFLQAESLATGYAIQHQHIEHTDAYSTDSNKLLGKVAPVVGEAQVLYHII